MIRAEAASPKPIGSVRLFLRRGQKLDLRIDKIPQDNCCLDIEADAGGDYRITIDWPLESGSESTNAQREVDDAVNDAASTEQVGIDNRDIERIGNQTCPNLSALLRHQPDAFLKSRITRLAGNKSGVES